MGNAKRHREELFLRQPNCIFCGGGVVATTIEHCPPKTLFQNREWPEGFEFSACAACNHGSSDQDVLVAMMARLDPSGSGNNDGRAEGLMRNANRQYPGLLARMLPSPIEARRRNRALGVVPPPGMTHQEMGNVAVTIEMHEAVSTLARKLMKGVYHLETSAVFPADACLLLNWFSSGDLLRDGRWVVAELFDRFGGKEGAPERGGKYLDSQFAYKVANSEDGELWCLQATFSKSFGFIVVGSTVPGRLESMIERLRERDAHNVYAVLQSVILPVTQPEAP